MFLEDSQIEEILCTLDKEGHIFPEYEIVNVNNRLRILGMGGFSRVYEMNYRNRPENTYVLKVIGFETHVMTSEEFWNSIRLQSALSEQTPYICRFISAKEICIALDDEGKLRQVTEVKGERLNRDDIYVQFMLMDKLEDIIERKRFGYISLKREELAKEDEVLDFALQVGLALYHAHTNNILHRDVKLENIFWDAVSKKYKLGDFGIAKYTAEGRAETVAYTNGYGAPELENHLYDSYDATADIYSFGITLYLLLNDFKFPGSEGYYVNLIQYNPEFVFPAPCHASDGMVRIIRKMCQYYPEHRYKSMAEVLMDLKECKNNKRKMERGEFTGISDEETELYEEVEPWNQETETYREELEFLDFETVSYEETFSDKNVEGVRIVDLKGRAKRKEDERIQKEIYNKFSIAYFIGLTVLITLLTGSLQTDNTIIQNLQFWMIPVMALVETVLLKVKEFHIVFGVVTLVVGVVMCITMGISVPYVILLGGIITGIPVISGACVAAIAIWAVLAANDKLQWMNFIGKFDLDWILLAVVIFLLFRYGTIHILYGIPADKKTEIKYGIAEMMYLVMIVAGIVMLILERFGSVQIPEIFRRIHLIRTGLISLVVYFIYIICTELKVREEQTYENEMAERGNGKRSDTIE